MKRDERKKQKRGRGRPVTYGCLRHQVLVR